MSKKLLIATFSGLSQSVRAIGALKQLRAAYEYAEIAVVAKTELHDFFQLCPYVDRVINADHPSELFLESFDVALLARTAGSRITDSQVADSTSRAPVVRAEEILYFGSIAELRQRAAYLCDAAVTPRSLLWPAMPDRNAAARLLRGLQRPIAVFHVASVDRDKTWNSAGWALMIDQIDSLGMQPVLIGAKNDAHFVDDVVIRSSPAPLDLCGKTSLAELAGVLERALLFVGVDSGPAALAQSLTVHSIVIQTAKTETTVDDAFIDEENGSIDAIGRSRNFEILRANCDRCIDLSCECAPPYLGARVKLETALAATSQAGAQAIDAWHQQRI